MSCVPINGYLTGSQLRRNFIIAAWMVGAIVLTFYAAMWYFTILSFGNGFIAGIITMLFITSGIVYLSYSGYKTFRVLTITYSCCRDSLKIEDRQRTYTLDLSASFFASRIQIRFYYGKSSMVKDFYVFSSKPITDSFSKYYGVNAIRKILQPDRIVIPHNEEINCWLLNCKGIGDIPEYPKALCYPAKTANSPIS